MDNNEFKKLFGAFAEKHGFIPAFKAWYKESNDCFIILELQKSNNGNYYKLNIKIFVKGMFNINYTISKDLIRKMGNILDGEPREYSDFLHLGKPIEDKEREKGLYSLFVDYIVPFTDRALSRKGIEKLYQEDQVFLQPAVKAELARLSNESNKRQ